MTQEKTNYDIYIWDKSMNACQHKRVMILIFDHEDPCPCVLCCGFWSWWLGVDINAPMPLSRKMRFQFRLLARLAKWLDRRHGTHLFFFLTNVCLSQVGYIFLGDKVSTLQRVLGDINKGWEVTMEHQTSITSISLNANCEGTLPCHTWGSRNSSRNRLK